MDKQTAKQLLRDALADPTKGTIIEPEVKKSISLKLIIAIAMIITIGVYLVTSSKQSGGKTAPEPFGKIHSPGPGAITGKEVTVIAETKNLEPGQYIWLAVDKPGISLCWPKKQLHGNSKFTTTILEEGPKEPYTLSLYAVNKTINDQWQEWLDAGRLGGLPMPPDRRRLDSVRLIFGNT